MLMIDVLVVGVFHLMKNYLRLRVGVAHAKFGASLIVNLELS